MVETKGIMNVGMMKIIDQTSTSSPMKFDEMFQTLKRIDSKLDKLITMMFPEEITPKTSHKENGTVSSPQIASSIIDYGIGELPESSAGRAKQKMRLPVIEFPVFEGKDPIGWVKKAQQCFEINSNSKEHKVPTAKMNLKGKASIWFFACSESRDVVSWDEIASAICERFMEAVDYDAIQVANEEIHESILNKNSTKENLVKVFDEMLLESALPLIVDKPEIGVKLPTEKPLKFVEGADSESNHSGNNFVQLVPNMLMNGEWIKGWPDYSKTCDVVIKDEIKIWNVAFHEEKSVLWSIKIYMYKGELEYVGYYVVMKDETITHLIFDPGGHAAPIPIP